MGLLAAGTAAGLAGPTSLLRVGDAWAAARGAPRDDGVVNLGRAYLRQHPSEARPQRLIGDLSGLDRSEPVRAQLPRLAPEVTSDFEHGRIVSVEGWLLARTEARAAGAVALGH